MINFSIVCFVAIALFGDLGHCQGPPPPPRSGPGPTFPQGQPQFSNTIISPEQRAKLDEMGKNWTKLRRKMCSMPNSDASRLYTQMESCNKINHVYRIQQLLKSCHLIKAAVQASNQTSYLDFERAECQFEECHMKVLNSPEYLAIMSEMEKMSPDQRMSKAFERYKCISNALGV